MSFFVKAFNAAAAAAAMVECAKLWRQLEEERELVQRLKQEKEDEAEMAQKDVEYATARADVAESKCAILERIVIEEGKTIQRLVIEKDNEAEQAKREIENMGRELAYARKEDQYAQNDFDIAERECAKLKRLLEEEKKLARRLILEKDDEVQQAKRKIEEIDQELAHARKDAELAQKDADAAEKEWTKVRRHVKEKEELVKFLNLEILDIRKVAMRQVGEIKSQELEEARNKAEHAQYDADIAQRECAKLKRLLEEEKKLARRLLLEKDNEVQLAKRKIEEIDQELAHARKDAELARKDAKSECAHLKRMLIERKKIVQRLKIEKDDEVEQAKKLLEEEKKLARRLILEKDNEVQLAKRKIEEIDQELAHARKDAELARKDAKSECANLERMLIEERKTIQRLIIEKDDEAERAKREIEKMGRELACARNDADIAENKWTKVKREVNEKVKFIKRLKLEIQDTRQDTMRQVEEISKELEEARSEAEHAQNDANIATDCAICLTNEKDLAFGCGHMTCGECGKTMSKCPICRKHITIRIKLFP